MACLNPTSSACSRRIADWRIRFGNLHIRPGTAVGRNSSAGRRAPSNDTRLSGSVRLLGQEAVDHWGQHQGPLYGTLGLWADLFGQVWLCHSGREAAVRCGAGQRSLRRTERTVAPSRQSIPFARCNSRTYATIALSPLAARSRARSTGWSGSDAQALRFKSAHVHATQTISSRNGKARMRAVALVCWTDGWTRSDRSAFGAHGGISDPGRIN